MTPASNVVHENQGNQAKQAWNKKSGHEREQRDRSYYFTRKKKKVDRWTKHQQRRKPPTVSNSALRCLQFLLSVPHCHCRSLANIVSKMGIMMSRLFETLFGSKEVRILILGLDNAGKTTILYRLQNESDEAVQTIPTIGFNVETLQYKNIKVSVEVYFWDLIWRDECTARKCSLDLLSPVIVAFTQTIFICFYVVQFQVWDLGGQTSIRPYWRCYYPNTDAIIFVVDSADVDRMSVAKGELAAMLEEEDLKDAILLVFANKQDQKGAMNAEQISDALGLPEVRNRQWSIQETSALKGKGLFEGFDWLVTSIKGEE